jgi:zinc transport system substrate-binding protein
MRALQPSLVVLICATLLGACTATDPSAGRRSSQLRVVTTFFPITAFTRAVAGDCATVEPLLPANVSPHDFQSSPADLVRVREADVLVKNGLGLESFLDKLIANAENPRLKVIDTSVGVKTLADDGGDHVHNDGHGHGAVNPHIWLDPLRAIQQVETIRKGLSAAHPVCRQTFEANAADLTAQLRSLDQDLASRLRPYAGKSFVTFHDFAPYFAERYGLKVDFLVEVPEENPTPADLQRVSKRVKASELRTLLSEPQEGSRSFNALASDLGVKLSLFDPLETGPSTATGSPSPTMAEHYLVTMRRNVRTLAGDQP